LANAVDLIAALDGAVRAGILRQTKAPLVVPAVLGPDAGLIGAAEAGSEAGDDCA
jgi:N-acetylglucosamine kinase